MKSYLPLLTFAILLTSCSSVYRSGQTPDDVYFSPERQYDEYVRVDDREERMYRNEELDREDRYLRMKTRNRRYGLLDNDYDLYAYSGPGYYRYNDYYRMNGWSYNQQWWRWNNSHNWNVNPYYHNPYWGNPYYGGVVYGNINPKYNKPRTSNLNVYGVNGSEYNSNGTKRNSRTFGNSTNNGDNYRNSGTNAGNFLRGAFGGNNNSSNSSNAGKSSVNNGSNSSNNNSSSGSSSSGSSRAPVRKF